jgi:hypothetical protein
LATVGAPKLRSVILRRLAGPPASAAVSSLADTSSGVPAVDTPDSENVIVVAAHADARINTRGREAAARADRKTPPRNRRRNETSTLCMAGISKGPCASHGDLLANQNET